MILIKHILKIYIVFQVVLGLIGMGHVFGGSVHISGSAHNHPSLTIAHISGAGYSRGNSPTVKTHVSGSTMVLPVEEPEPVQSETIRKVIFPAALPGIVGALLLAISRAIGETMIVVMAAGLAANLTVNPFSAVTTVTVQIVTLLVGDQEFDSPKTLAAFALGLVLFFITLILNIISMVTVRKYRERYE